MTVAASPGVYSHRCRNSRERSWRDIENFPETRRGCGRFGEDAGRQIRRRTVNYARHATRRHGAHRRYRPFRDRPGRYRLRRDGEYALRRVRADACATGRDIGGHPGDDVGHHLQQGVRVRHGCGNSRFADDPARRGGDRRGRGDGEHERGAASAGEQQDRATPRRRQVDRLDGPRWTVVPLREPSHGGLRRGHRRRVRHKQGRTGRVRGAVPPAGRGGVGGGMVRP